MSETANDAPAQPAAKTIGFWQCWAFSVGTMIGSGIFMMPAVLAPYGGLSFGGWLLTATGSIMIALVIGRLAGRTTRSGGISVYVEDTVGGLPAFLVTWLYWIGCWTSNAGLAIAFVGYFIVIAPAVGGDPVYQIGVALAAIWTLTLVAMRGSKDAGFVQLLLTVLKLAPLALIVGLGVFAGEAENLPAFNPTGEDPMRVLSITALATMYAFLGLEIGAVPAANVRDPQRTGPRAVVIATITAAAVYIASTAAVMALVPPDVLATSTSPFADAARALGAWAPLVITIGALISVAGALNGSIFVTGQTPMAAANEGQAPKIFGRLNRKDAPWFALVFSGVLASVLLLMNYSRGLVSAYTFVLIMATLTTLVPYLVCGLIELRHSWRSAKGWALVSLVAAIYAVFAIYGSGLEALMWCGILTAIGVPVYYLGRPKRALAVAG
jgi:APA family basic amino acid/polyamine antiporter